MTNIGVWPRRERDAKPVKVRSDINSTDWVRLIPVFGPEMAEVATLDPPDVGSPSLFIDRKLAPFHDLMEPMRSRVLVCSERLVKALEAIGATGWTARLVPHLTPNAVGGHRIYVLETEGWTGPLQGTEVRFKKKTPEEFYPPGTDTHLNGVPVPPISFDASKGTGHEICWSPWFNGPSNWWRALIMRGDVFCKLQERIPNLVLGVEKVRMSGATYGPPGTPGKVLAEASSFPRVPELDELLNQLHLNAVQYQHTLSPGAPAEAVTDAFNLLGSPVNLDLQRILTHWNGVRLYDGALVIHGVEAQGKLVSRNREVRGYAWYRVPPGHIIFGEMTDGSLLWALDNQGFVQGYGRDELVYGPNVPFRQWFADQLSDLAYVWDHRSEISWASRVLYG